MILTHSGYLYIPQILFTLYFRPYRRIKVHYLFVLWLQRILMNNPIHAGFKFVLVFSGAAFLSWITAQLLLKIPKVNQIL
jgi:glucan biosynthesis protein C